MTIDGFYEGEKLASVPRAAGLKVPLARVRRGLSEGDSNHVLAIPKAVFHVWGLSNREAAGLSWKARERCP